MCAPLLLCLLCLLVAAPLQCHEYQALTRVPLLSLLILLPAPRLCYEYGGHYQEHQASRIVETRQGLLKGSVRTLRGLGPVEVFLGVPYAAAPVGSHRFMPPGSPPPWSGTKTADSFGPVCPQTFPPRPATTVPSGRWGHMDRVRHLLSNQSEDCLFLNIYAPARADQGGASRWDRPPGGGGVDRPSPVIVFIHGESFEWNSGNLYDGSVLASYGKVVVVTINFRLGILGFLKPGVSDHVPSNFGLYDQVAALEWVRTNIGQFGGDPARVTLMGHGTGAACVSYLMISPLAQGDGHSRGGLFKRAVLMSGTALSDWALSTNPVQVTVQVAQALNCPDSEDRMSDCLRRKRLHELEMAAVSVHVPPFKTAFGPVIDGQVIPNDPASSMKDYRSLFEQYDLMIGLTELESYFLLSDVDLVHGMVENEFYEKLSEYLNAKYEKLPDLARTKTISYYRTWERLNSLSAAESHRNTLLEILSDARVAAPAVRTADYHSQANPRSFLYVFAHLTKFADHHPWIQQSVQGEELPYVFGVPLLSTGPTAYDSYSPHERLLSEAVMTMWSNFAKYGNPNQDQRHRFHTLGQREWRQFDLEWPQYNTFTQHYYNIDLPPSIKQYYKQDKMSFWNHELPLSLNNSDLPYRLLPTPPPPPWTNDRDPQSHPGGAGTVVHPEPERPRRPGLLGPERMEPVGQRPSEEAEPGTGAEDSSVQLTAIASSVTLSVVIFVGICFLVVNMCAFFGVYYQRDRLQVRERLASTRYRCVNLGRNEDEDAEDRYTKSSEAARAEGNGEAKPVEIKSILKSSDGGGTGTYEQVRTGKTASVGKRMGVSRQASSSTVTIDPHTKVKEWIAQEIVHRCSPRFLRKGRKTGSCDNSADHLDRMSNKTESNASKIGSLAMQRQKAKKVSVAVDATPATRSASVLQQTPIELTKSMDDGLALSGSGGLKASTSLMTVLKKPSLTRSDAMSSEESVTGRVEPLRRSTSINLQLLTSDSAPRIAHFHSRSELVDESSDFNTFGVTFCPEKGPCEVIYSTVQKRPKDPVNKDVNVTSRDDLNADASELSAEEALDSIRRRNYPKVLPDYPDEEDFHLQKAAKRRSLPLSNQIAGDPGGGDNPLTLKVPPPPPPRVSTLGRKPQGHTPPSQLAVKLRPTDNSQVPVAVRPAPILGSQDSKTAQVRRVEPRVIIKPTMNPITGKKDSKNSVSNIPRVTPPQPANFGSSRDLSRTTPMPSKIPELGGMGRKAKITPVKKTVSTETATEPKRLDK